MRAQITSHLLAVFLALLGCGYAEAAPPAHLWSYSLGGTSSDRGLAVAVDPSGNVFLVGWFQGTADFNQVVLTTAGSSDIVVLKYNAGGVLQWARRFGGVGQDFGYDVAIDPAGNVIATGAFSNSVDFGGGALTSAGLTDIFLLKLDTNGNHLWSRRFGSGLDDAGFGVAVDGTGAVHMTGQCTGAVDLGAGLPTGSGINAFVVRYDPTGAFQWARRFGNPSALAGGNSVAVDPLGHVALTGRFRGTIDFGGGPLASHGFDDIFVMMFDAAGSHLWSHVYGASLNDSGHGVTTDPAGSVYVTGSFDGGAVDFGGGPLANLGSDDAFLVKLDVNGVHQWSRRFGAALSDMGNKVAAVGTTHVVVGGAFYGSVDFGGGPLASSGQDLFLARYTSAGAHEWSLSGGSGSDLCYGLAVASNDDVVATGQLSGPLDFGGGPLSSAGGIDMFIVRLAEDRATGSLLELFQAESTDAGIRLRWRLRSETSRDVVLERADAATGPWSSIDAATRTEDGATVVLDRTAMAGRTYYYRLVATTSGGEFEVFGPLAHTRADTAAGFLLERVTPNPSAGVTRIDYAIPNESRVRLSIVDLQGREAEVLLNAMRQPGRYQVTWDGRMKGRKAPAGIYFIRLQTPAGNRLRRLTLVR